MKFIVKTIILLAALLIPLTPAVSGATLSLDGLHIEGYEGSEVFLGLSKNCGDGVKWTRVSMEPSRFGITGEVLSPNGIYPGAPSVTLRVRSGRRMTTGIYRLEWRALMAFAAKDLDRGRILSPDDIDLREDIYKRSYGSVFSEITSLVGKRVTRRLGAGDPLSDRDVETVMTVERGDRLLVISRAGSVEAKLPGVALESGFKGATIRVKIGKYRKDLYAVVLNHGTVLVED